MSVDAAIPDRFWPAVHWATAYVFSWILPLVAVERFVDGHPVAGFILSAFTLVDWFIAAKWSSIGQFVADRRRSVGITLIAVGILLLCLGIFLLTAGTVTNVGSEMISPLEAGIAANEKWKNYVPKRIIGQSFYNQEVILDGNEYIDCEFHRVTFVYDGNSPIRLSGSKLEPPFVYKTKNPSIETAWSILPGTGVNIDIFGAGKSTIQKPQTTSPDGN